MSRARFLTDPDDIAASDEFKRLLLASKKSQGKVAEEIGEGISQGTIWQWANRRLSIPANRAVDAARAVAGNPIDISPQYRELMKGATAINPPRPAARLGERPALPYGESQNLGIPLSTISDAMLVVKAYVEDRGLPAVTATEPLLIKTAIDLVNEAAEPLTLTNVIAFKRRLTERLEGGNDGSSEVAATG